MHKMTRAVVLSGLGPFKVGFEFEFRWKKLMRREIYSLVDRFNLNHKIGEWLKL